MRFVDFVKTTVLACAGAATALAAVALLNATRQDDTDLVVFSLGWWIAATLIGAALGRHAETTPPIARLLAGATSTTTLPEQQPGRVVLNRLWPLLLVTIVAAGVAFALPQVASIAAGFEIIWALYWRRQDAAVTAVEERDGVSFHVERTSPLKPIRLVRVPGFRRIAPPSVNGRA